MASVFGTNGYLTIVYIFRCTHCGKELILDLQENKTKAIKEARERGWRTNYAGWYCREYSCGAGARDKAKRMKAAHIPNYMLLLAE